MAKSLSVITNCNWEYNRISILFIDKELSIDITIQEAKELFSQLGKTIKDYESLEKGIEEYSSNKD
jgi:hypothetical protein